MSYTNPKALEQGKRLKEIILDTKQVPYRKMKRKKVAAIGFQGTSSRKGYSSMMKQTPINYSYQLYIRVNPLELEVEKHFLPIRPVNPTEKMENKIILLYSNRTLHISVDEIEKKPKTHRRREITRVYAEDTGIMKDVFQITDGFRQTDRDELVMPLNKKQLEEITKIVWTINQTEDE